MSPTRSSTPSCTPWTAIASFLAQPAHTVKRFTDHRNLAKFLFSTNLLKSHDAAAWTLAARRRASATSRSSISQALETLVPDFPLRYGYPDPAEPEPRVLLPLGRFSTKAQVDIKRWFKKHAGDKNIRQVLEERFASVPDVP